MQVWLQCCIQALCLHQIQSKALLINLKITCWFLFTHWPFNWLKSRQKISQPKLNSVHCLQNRDLAVCGIPPPHIWTDNLFTAHWWWWRGFPLYLQWWLLLHWYLILHACGHMCIINRRTESNIQMRRRSILQLHSAYFLSQRRKKAVGFCIGVQQQH